jgi:hypothetical protein
MNVCVKEGQEVTLEIGGGQLSLPVNSITEMWLQRLQRGSSVARGKAPKLGERWDEQGGVNAAIMRGRDGHPDYHLIVPDVQEFSVAGVTFGSYGKEVPGARSDWDGLANFNALIESVNAGNSHPAAQEIFEMRTRSQFKDLYLPARHEARACYLNVPELFPKEWCHTSTEYSALSAYAQYFYDGYQYYYTKDSEARAFAVRRVLVL